MKREEKIKLIDSAIEKIKIAPGFWYLCVHNIKGSPPLTVAIPELKQKIENFFIKHGHDYNSGSCFQQLFVPITNCDDADIYDNPKYIYKSNQFRIRFLERFKKTL